MLSRPLEDLFWACVGGIFGLAFGVLLVAAAVHRRFADTDQDDLPPTQTGD